MTNAPTTLGGTITIESDGNFTYHPDDVDTGVTDTFTYRVCDASPCNSGTVANATGTLSLPIAGQVWYVRNNEPARRRRHVRHAVRHARRGRGRQSGTGDTVVRLRRQQHDDEPRYGLRDERERAAHRREPAAVARSGRWRAVADDRRLFPGTCGAQPTLTASNEDVIVLASNVLVDGVDVDPSGTGGGISGGAGTDRSRCRTST